jgi:hypothetical protein
VWKRAFSAGSVVPEAMQPTNRERRAISFRALALVGIVVAICAGIGSYVAYRELIHYERRAVDHVPLDTAAVLRLDLEQVVLFEPVRRYLLPVVSELPLTEVTKEAGEAAVRRDRLASLRESGINLAFDLREIMVAIVAPTGGWVVVLGGLFEREGMVDAIERLLREEGVSCTRTGSMLRLDFWGSALAQANDGALILASSPAVLESALPTSQRYVELGVTREGAGGVFFAPNQLRRWLGTSTSWFGGSWLDKLQRFGVTLGLGDEQLELVGRFDVEAPPDLDSVTHGIEGWLGAYDSVARFVPQADWGGERAILARARVVQASETSLLLSSTWQQTEFERAIRSLAAWLERRLQVPPPAPRR